MSRNRSVNIWYVILIGLAGIYTVAFVIIFCTWLVTKCKSWKRSGNETSCLRSNYRAFNLRSKSHNLESKTSPDEVCTYEDVLSKEVDPRQHETHSCSQPKLKQNLKSSSNSYNGMSTAGNKSTDFGETPTLKLTSSYREDNGGSRCQSPGKKDSLKEQQHFFVNFENEK